MNYKEKGKENGEGHAFAAATNGVWGHGLTKRELFAMVFTHALIARDKSPYIAIGGMEAYMPIEGEGVEETANAGLIQADELLRQLEGEDGEGWMTKVK